MSDVYLRVQRWRALNKIEKVVNNKTNSVVNGQSSNISCVSEVTDLSDTGSIRDNDSDSSSESDSNSSNSDSVENNNHDQLPGDAGSQLNNEEVTTKKTLNEKLRCWTLNNLNILTLNVITELLTILREEGHEDLPKTSKQLLKTKHCRPKKSFLSKRETSGSYIYIGIKIVLKKIISPNIYTGLSDVLNSIAELSESKLIRSNDHLEAEKNDKAAFENATEPKGITNYDDLAKYLQRIICSEMSKVKKSVNYTIGQQVKKILEVVQQSGDAPNKQKAWNIIGDDLPYGDIATFVEFDESLKDNEEKRKALTEIFQMVAAGCTKYEDDIYKIMEKMIKKEVQLKYSGCGKKIKGVGKLSFRETETYQIMEKFIMVKYQTSKEKIAVITAVSAFLSGAKDREGGRAQRNKEN
ncbi:uncharacterized protein LOC141525658 [Cotesia typhae]|uniref:uncharacterized protein LOC141525658 n=1 Tax=Cotesia typhae TaxID=2053667 RepID=UPI003D693924